MSTRPLVFIALVALLLPACGGDPADSDSQGIDLEASPPVFRSVLDMRPRMVTVRLGDDLWASYSAVSGGLYRVWRDGVDLDGAVYTTVHGPQPTSIGPAYVESDSPNGWRLLDGDRTLPVEARYLGHAYEDDRPSLLVRLRTPNGPPIVVTERPRRVRDDQGRAGLERSFTTEGVPDGLAVALAVPMTSLAAEDAVETDGDLDAGSGLLTLNANGSTTFTTYYGEPTIPKRSFGPDESKPEGLELIERSDCAACHNPTVQTVGPSYQAIAERYEAGDLNVVRLANKIIDGGTGAWGEAVMSPHPGLSEEDARTMVSYILSLGGQDAEEGGVLDVSDTTYPLTDDYEGTEGLAVNIYGVTGGALMLDSLETTEAPFYSGAVPALHTKNEFEMGEVFTNIYLTATGFLNIPETDNYVIRLVSDDGSRLFLDGAMLVDNDGPHGVEARDTELILEEGAHPIRVEFFQGGGGAALSLQWARHGDDAFSVIPASAFTYEAGDLRETIEYEVATGTAGRRPGDTIPLEDVHPSFEVQTIRPEWFEPKVGGLDVLDDGRVVVSTWDPDGSVYLISNVDAENRDDLDVKRIAWGLAEPLGLTVVDGDIYVMQKQELTRLVDSDGDDVIDRYEVVANDWGATANFHEFGFGLLYRDGHFYGSLATAILPGGASADPQNPDRGSVIRIDRETGEVDIIARGLRTPNGMTFGVDDEIFLADNQGDWLPASKIVHIEEGDFHGSRSVDFEGTEGMEWKRPVVWLPQDEIGNSPSQPALLNVGPYENQMIHGEVTHGGIKRVFVEEVGGQYQGAVFRFTQGLEAGVNRLAWGNDDWLYVGGVGNPGNWGHVGKLMHGLQRMRYTGDPVFEMLAIRALPDGFEIEFTEPLADGVGTSPDDYEIQQWFYEPTAEYGGPKLDLQALQIDAVEVADDRRRVRLALDGLAPDHVVYFHLNDATLRSEHGRQLWSTEAWYTLNRIPTESVAVR